MQQENDLINKRLRELYEEYTPEFLGAWTDAFGEVAPCRMDEFGIIDINRYDSKNGILFIGRETNGWSNAEFEEGCLFREWMCDISQNGLKGRGHIARHPNMWYNIGRWALLLQNPGTPIRELARLKDEAINALGTVAFTNVNKVRGKRKSGTEYRKLADTDVVKSLIQKEVAIINPKIIVTCGTYRKVAGALPDYEGLIFCMNHPGARKSSKKMLEDLKVQIDTNK